MVSNLSHFHNLFKYKVLLFHNPLLLALNENLPLGVSFLMCTFWCVSVYTHAQEKAIMRQIFMLQTSWVRDRPDLEI